MKSKFKKKRLIFFLPNFSLGGASESIFKLSKFLKKYNFSILIISLGKNFYKKEFKKINCDVFEINLSKAIFSIFEIRRKIIEETNKNFHKTIFISNIHYANIISIFSLINLKNFLEPVTFVLSPTLTKLIFDFNSNGSNPERVRFLQLFIGYNSRFIFFYFFSDKLYMIICCTTTPSNNIY